MTTDPTALTQSQTTTAARSGPVEPDPRRWWTLAVLCMSLMIVIVGNTALNIAIPTLSKSLGASTTQLQWMVAGYSLVFAGMLLTAGAAGDRYGRKGALQFGLLLFLGATLAASLSSTPTEVIACRAVMGFAGAFVMPSTLSILTTVFPPHERTKAIAIWAGIAGGGAAIGPIAAGLLLAHFWWGSVFLVNVPIVVIALATGHFLVPTSRDPNQGRLDPIGAGLSIIGIGTLVYTIIEAPDRGWASTDTLMLFAAAALVMGVFGWWELRTKEPMLNLYFFRNPELSVATGGMTLVFFAMFGVFFLMTQYFQLVHGWGPLSTGIRLGPMALVMISVAPNTPRLAARIGRNRVVGGGMATFAIGMLLWTRIDIGTSYAYVAVSMVVISTGMALTMSPMTASIMSGVPDAKAGIGSALNDTSRELGGALGVAVLGSLVTSRYITRLAPTLTGLSTGARTVANRSLAGALDVASGLGSQRGTLALEAKKSFISGIHLAFLVAAVVAATGSVIAFRLLPDARRRPAMQARMDPVTSTTS